MKIIELMTPVAEVAWLSVTDTVADAFDHMETNQSCAAPILDATGRYVGTVTVADLRRHVEGMRGRGSALSTPLADLERRARNPAITLERDVASVVEHAAAHRFVPVVDDGGRLIGIVDRRRLLVTPLPSAA